uniref:Uncharacterized protein n=1 Tax=Panagrolaimus davidi TaxID=227884 RepID=A0A914QE27_9BILA
MESFNKLLNFKFLNKFKKLQFLMVETEFDPISLCKFLKENFDDNADFALILYPYRLEREMMPRVHEIIHRWDSKKPKSFHF